MTAVAPPGELTSSGVESETRTALAYSAAQLDAAGAPATAVEALHALSGQIGQPCVIAVVGQVNAGKSTFINALLGADKAVTGSTETTATINHFIFGRPDPDRPVRCCWRGGRVTEETSEFLAGLQGRDLEALRRADGIDRLEYLLANPMLKAVTLVDTPGTGAVVTEHQSRAVEFLNLARTLRSRHEEETLRIHDAADAIVYLVGAVARTSDHELLEAFTNASGGRARAMNALGVIAKVDLSPMLMERRHQLAEKIAGQLESQLNAVVPVSAALARAVDRLSGAEDDLLARLVNTVRRIPAEQLDLLLENEELFESYDPSGCPVPASERADLRRAVHCEWRAFATMVGEARAPGSPVDVEERLRALSGFGALRRMLNDHFLERAQILRCYRIVRDARALLKDLWFDHVVTAGRRARADEAQLQRFLAFVDRPGGDSEVAVELRTYLRSHLGTAERAERLEHAWKDVDAGLATLMRRLGEHNEDFSALQELEASATDFSEGEIDELRALLGMYGTDIERRLQGDFDVRRCVARQVRWRLARDRSPRGTTRWRVADRAHTRLGLVLAELGERI